MSTPWTAEARTLVLHDADGDWRYAIYTDVGVTDGRLDGLPAGAAPEQAQAALLARVAELTGHHHCAVWETPQPHWWTADLATAR
jgi:hypothetical protein